MLQLTIKTLDCKNHAFEVEDETTVAELKEKIRETLGLELDRQRLIFGGKVLKDEQRLIEAGIDSGKCLHLVQRAPPSPQSRRRDRDRMEGGNAGNAGDSGARTPNPLPRIRNLMRSSPSDLHMEQQITSISPTAGRINFIRGVIIEIRGSLVILRQRTEELEAARGSGNDESENMETEESSGEAQAQPEVPPGASGNDESVNMETESSCHAQPQNAQPQNAQPQNALPQNALPQNAQAQPENADQRDDFVMDEDAAHARRTRRLRDGMGPHFYANPRDLARCLQDLDILHDEFAPYRAHYVAMLRSLSVDSYPVSERPQRQELVRLICDVMHSFAHCYHCISDITFNVGQPYPRLTSEPPAPTRHSIPLQVPAQFNLVAATGPHPMSDAGAGNSGAAATSATTANTATGATATTATGATATGVTASGANAPTATGATATATHLPPAGQASTARPAGSFSAAPDNELQTTSETFNVRHSSTDRTPIHTTTRTFTRPGTEGSSPSSYQVEIETRGHIAIPLDSNILSGLAAVASNLRQAQGQHDRAIADAQAARAAARAAANAAATASATAASTASATAASTASATAASTEAATAESDPIRPPSNRRRQNMPPALIALENLDLICRRYSTAQGAGSAPTAPFAPDAPPTTPALAQQPLVDPVRGDVLGHYQRELLSRGADIAQPATNQPNLPMGPVARPANGNAFVGSAPMNIGPRNAPAQEAATAVANPAAASQSGASEAAEGTTSGATGSAPPDTRASPRTPQGHSHVHFDGSRPRILLELENLMRNVTGGVGMEVVMSMEEIPNFLSGAGLAANDPAGVYVTPLFAAHNVGGSPTADLLQNIVAIVRNRIMPQDLPQNQGQSQNRGQGQAQNHGQSQNRGSDQSYAERRNQWQAPWGGPLRHQPDAEYPFAMACLAYDRHLNCDSVFARHHLQQRREVYRRQAEEEQRERAARLAPPNIEFLAVRNPIFTTSHMSTMMRLLNEPVTVQGQLNAFMVTIARQVFLTPRGHGPYTTPPPAPAEFARIRIQLREYIQRMLEDVDSFEEFADRLIAQMSSILGEIPTITVHLNEVNPPEVDAIATLRALTRARLPSVIASIMSESSSDRNAARFYNVLYRFFGDICRMFIYFIDGGFPPLVRRFDEFVATITENYGSATRTWLRLVAHENIVASRSYILAFGDTFDVQDYYRQPDGCLLPPLCCLYEAQTAAPRLERAQLLLPLYCTRHLRLLQPLQAPPLFPPDDDDDDFSRGSTPMTASEDGQGEHADGEEDAETWQSEPDGQAEAPDSQAETPAATPQPEGPSTNGSPSPSRSVAQAETDEASVADSEASPRRLRRWGRQSPSASQSLASDLTSESHPPGLIAINLADSDSLCDVEELDVAAVVDDIDPYVCEYTEIRRPIVYSPLNILEDDVDDTVHEDNEDVDDTVLDDNEDVDDTVDEGNKGEEAPIDTIEEDPSLMAEELEIRKRREKRERSICRDLARRRLEGDIRHKKFITMREAGTRLDIRALQQSARKLEFDTCLQEALDRVVKQRKKLEKTEEQAHGTDEEHEEISEKEKPLKQESTCDEEDSSTVGRDEDPEDDPEIARLKQVQEHWNEELEPFSDYFSNRAVRLTLLESIVSLAGELSDDEPDDLFQEPGPSRVCPHRMPEEFDFIYVDPVSMIPTQMSRLNINEPEFLQPILVRSNVRDDNGLDSDDESNNEYLSPINHAAPAADHRPERGADDDWYSLPEYHFPHSELDNDGYYSPQLSMFHERPGFLTPQPIRANAAGPSAATTKSVSDLSDELYDKTDDYLNSMVAHLRVHSGESSEPEQVATQTSPLEAGRKDIPYTSDDLDLATLYSSSSQAPMESILENEDWRSIMGTSWEPVLREDGAAQVSRPRPQPPFSDAYLTGMPARKRRCLRDSRPDATLDALMNEGLRGVSEGVPGGLRGGESELTQQLLDSVRGLVAARARDQPEDYEPTRFPNTAAFLANADSTKTKEPEEKTPTPPKNDVPDSVE